MPGHIRPAISPGLLISFCIPLILGSPLLAGDWPQILGVQRDGVARDEQPIRPWSGTPKSAWEVPVGQGYAGPAIAAGKVFVFHRLDDAERLEAIDLESGQRLWKVDFEATYRGGVNPDEGPRCVPTVQGDRVFVYGAAGDVHCVRVTDGQKVWSRSAYQDFEGQEGYFGAGSSPIVAAGKLLVNVGGNRANAGIVAFDPKTGETTWRATEEDASYSSPTNATIDGDPVTIFVTRLNTVGIDPRDGKELFRFPFGRRGPTVNAATPLVFEANRLFVSAAYGVGGKLATIGKGPVRTVWENDSSMSSQYTTCVYYQGHLYGCHGREDFQNGELRCIEAETGEVKWGQTAVGVAHTILIGDQLLTLNIQGQLQLIRATPLRFESLAKAQVSDAVTRALPAYSNGRLVFRDNGGDGGRLICLALVKQ